MKRYQSIPAVSPNDIGKNCHIFVKYDGSNIRCEWSKSKGWYKFGSRNVLLDRSSDWGKQVVGLFTEKYADDLEKIFKTEKYFKGVDSVVVFCEYFGAKSFAGLHHADDSHDLVLFDVSPHKKGMMGSVMFLHIFGHLDVAERVHTGQLTLELILNIRHGSKSCVSKRPIRTLVPEGVICKGGDHHDLWMCKIKTYEYMAKLKENYKDNWEKYWE